MDVKAVGKVSGFCENSIVAPLDLQSTKPCVPAARPLFFINVRRTVIRLYHCDSHLRFLASIPMYKGSRGRATEFLKLFENGYCFWSLTLFIMSLQEKFPAYGGRGPSDFRLGIALGVIATTFMVLRIYVRLRINKFGTTALLLSLLAWVRTFSRFQ